MKRKLLQYSDDWLVLLAAFHTNIHSKHSINQLKYYFRRVLGNERFDDLARMIVEDDANLCSNFKATFTGEGCFWTA